MNKLKVINDPVYGFINVPFTLAFDVIEHPYFQRLRRIKQLGLTCLVYPGAEGTRFSHALGAMHLMQQAIQSLRFKGIDISESEAEGVSLAILLHDIGHGPFSHALEHAIVEDMQHERISQHIMQALNGELGGALDTCIAIFNGTYPKQFLHQLVSSQLDMDRLDYLNRDSFFTGVSEGVVGWDRIIKMLHVANDTLVVEEKGIYSVEKFLVARRLMYWQAYLHKTSVAAELMLMHILRRAKELSRAGEALFATPSLAYFLQHNLAKTDFCANSEALGHFMNLDDYDVWASIKVWCAHPDLVLSLLCQRLVARKLHKMQLGTSDLEPQKVQAIIEMVEKKFGTPAEHLVYTGALSNSVYNFRSEGIGILKKNGEVQDIALISGMIAGGITHQTVVKNYICYPS